MDWLCAWAGMAVVIRPMNDQTTKIVRVAEWIGNILWLMMGVLEVDVLVIASGPKKEGANLFTPSTEAPASALHSRRGKPRPGQARFP